MSKALDTVSNSDYILLVANRSALINSVLALETAFAATETPAIEAALIAAQEACYSAGLIDSDIYGQLTDTATYL